jgi:hypothetical protein
MNKNPTLVKHVHAINKSLSRFQRTAQVEKWKLTLSVQENNGESFTKLLCDAHVLEWRRETVTIRKHTVVHEIDISEYIPYFGEFFIRKVHDINETTVALLYTIYDNIIGEKSPIRVLWEYPAVIPRASSLGVVTVQGRKCKIVDILTRAIYQQIELPRPTSGKFLPIEHQSAIDNFTIALASAKYVYIIDVLTKTVTTKTIECRGLSGIGGGYSVLRVANGFYFDNLIVDKDLKSVKMLPEDAKDVQIDIKKEFISWVMNGTMFIYDMRNQDTIIKLVQIQAFYDVEFQFDEEPPKKKYKFC